MKTAKRKKPKAVVPAWHDVPTCLGLWMFFDNHKPLPSVMRVIFPKAILQRPETKWYGPIPSPPGDK